MRVAVIGAGAMGSIFGAALARSGIELVLYDNRADLIAAIDRDGISIDGALGKINLRPRATNDPRAIGPVDWALVLVDANATPAAAKIVLQCIVPSGFALTLQNGIGNVETLVDVLGAARVMAGSTYNSGATIGLARVLHSNPGTTVMGELDGSASARIADIATRLTAAGLPTTVSDNVMGVVWSKFIHNCAINPVSALTGLRPGEIARDPAAARLLELLLDEGLALVKRVGVHLPEHDPRGEIYDHAWERYNRPSMLQHLESGRGTEIDALNGALAKRARAVGLAAPVNEAVALAVKAAEARHAARQLRPEIDETSLEAAARANPRSGRWGEG